MQNVKKIVVGYDFSETAKAALLKAMELADRFQAKLSVIHAISPEIASPFVPAVELDLGKIVEKNLQQQLLDFVKQSGHHVPDVSVQVVQGVPHACLIAEAAAQSADLIVVGSHSRSAMGRFFLGSQALKVVRHAPMAVYVNHADANRAVQKILVPVDENETSELAIPEAKIFAQIYNATIQLVHVLNIPVYDYLDSQSLLLEAKKECQKYLEGLCREHALTLPPLILEGNPAHSIHTHITSDPQIGLVVLASHGRKGLERFLLGSVANQIVQQGPVPVVAIRSAEHKAHSHGLLAKGVLF